MATIKKDTLHPEGEPEVDIYPKTSIDQVENLQANLDALNGDISNANGEISSISNRVSNTEKNITDLQNDVNQNIMDISTAESNIQGLQGSVSEIAERVDTAETGLTQLTERLERVGNETNQNTSDISKLNTAYNSYIDYSTVTNGFLLTYVSGRQIELPIKAGTNVTFSKYPGTNQIIINATGGSVPDNIAILDANNIFTGTNTINKIITNNDVTLSGTVYGPRGLTREKYSLIYPNQTGTIALTTDLPNLADYPTTIFFNNYNAGIGYKDTSTGTTKTVVSTDNNGAQIVLGDSNTGLTLASNIRPKVLEDSTVKEVAYVSDIPAVPVIPDLGNFTFSGNNMNINGSTVISRSTGSPTEFIFGNYDNQFRSASNGLFTFYNQNAYAVINLSGKTGPQNIAFKSDIPSTSSFATLAGNNNWTGQNEFPNGISMYGGSFNTEYTPEGVHVISGDYRADYGGRWIATEYQGQSGTINIPQGKSGTMALVEDIPNTSSFATLAGNNKWLGDNTFDGFSKVVRVNGLFQVSGDEEEISATYNQISYDGLNIAYMDGENQNIFHAGIDYENKARLGFDKYDGTSYNVYIPEKNGIIATIEDIPNYNSVAGVSYDTTNGAIISYTNGKLITIPIKAGDGVTIDADKTNQNILISAPGGGSSIPQYNRGMGSATPTTFTYESGVYHTLTITLLSTYVSTTIILPNDYDGSNIDIELEGKSFLIMVVAGLLSVRNTTDNTEWVGKLE